MIEKMSGRGKYVYRGLVSIGLTVVAAAMFFFVWFRFARENNQTGHLLGVGNLLMALTIYIVLFIFFGRGLRAFRIGVERTANVIASIAFTVVVVNIAEIFISMAITGQFRFFIDFLWRYALLAAVQVAVLSALVILAIIYYRRLFPPLQILEIHGEYRNDLCDKINEVPYKYHVAKRIKYSGTEEEIRKQIASYDAVLINDLPAKEHNLVLKHCFDMDKRVYFVPKISDIIVKSSQELNVIDSPLFLCRNMGMGTLRRSIKRFADVVLSALALVVTSPVFLVTAILIKAEDGGSVFFRQERCTVGGERFQILKFRSMVMDAEKDGRPMPAEENDDRITKIGRRIRRNRIDELPQLINILRGEMSIVGPRPERVEHVEAYTKEIPEFTFRSKVKGGLTGYAQVYSKYNSTALDKLKLDVIYIMHYSLLLDIQIIFETIKILFRKESTEGFSQENAEKMHDAAIPADEAAEK